MALHTSRPFTAKTVAASKHHGLPVLKFRRTMTCRAQAVRAPPFFCVVYWLLCLDDHRLDHRKPGMLAHHACNVTILLQVSGKELAQRAAAAGAAVLLTAGNFAAPAVASEFDILAEPTPTKAYFVDDASVLSKATRSELNKRLGILEVRWVKWGVQHQVHLQFQPTTAG